MEGIRKVNLSDPVAQALVDAASIVVDLRHAVEMCEALLHRMRQPSGTRNSSMEVALWESAIISYGRCFRSGKGSRGARRWEVPDDLVDHLDEEMREWHEQACEERNRAVAHRVNQREGGTAIALIDVRTRRVVDAHSLMSRVRAGKTRVTRLRDVAAQLAQWMEHVQSDMRREIIEGVASEDFDELIRRSYPASVRIERVVEE